MPERSRFSNQVVSDLTWGVSLTGQLRQARGCGEVINSSSWVNQIGRLAQIALRKQIASQATDVSHLQRKFVGQFSRNREVHRIGIRSLHGLVNTPGNCLSK